jgi:hypothetical protein
MEYNEYTQSYVSHVAYKVHIGKKELKYFKRIFEAFDDDHDGYCDMEHLATSLRASGFLLTDIDVEHIRMYNGLRDASQFTLSNFFIMIANERRRLVSTLGKDYVRVQNQQCKHGFCGLYINVEGKSRKLLRTIYIPGSKAIPPGTEGGNGTTKSRKSPYEKNRSRFLKENPGVKIEYKTKTLPHGAIVREMKAVEFRQFSLPCEILAKKLTTNIGHPLSDGEYDAFTSLLEREYMHLSHDQRKEDPRVVYQDGRIHEYDAEGLYAWVCENLERFENEEVEGSLDVNAEEEDQEDEKEDKKKDDNNASGQENATVNGSNTTSQRSADVFCDDREGGDDVDDAIGIDEDTDGIGQNFDDNEEENAVNHGTRVEGEEKMNSGVRSYPSSDPMSPSPKQRAISTPNMSILAQGPGAHAPG